MLVVTMTALTSLSPPTEGRLHAGRIVLARRKCGLTQTQVAARLGVTSRTLHEYETDGAPAGRADELAAALQVRAWFFSLPEPVTLAPEQGFFRARRRATAAQLASARAHAVLGAQLYEWITTRFALPKLDLPQLDGEDPQTAAQTVRALWGLTEKPLPHLVKLSEAHGVRVLSLPPSAEAVDAFSMWLDANAYVLASTAKSAEHARFDLAHELGHLVMHGAVASSGEPHLSQNLEREANAFAAALLMPAAAVLAYAGREPGVPQILRLREYFRVSALAMTRRLHELGRLSDWGYRSNCTHLARRGYSHEEPGGITRERSRVFAQVFRLLREQGYGPTSMGDDLGLLPADVHALTFGQLAVPVEGGGQSVPSTPATKPCLSVV